MFKRKQNQQKQMSKMHATFRVDKEIMESPEVGWLKITPHCTYNIPCLITGKLCPFN